MWPARSRWTGGPVRKGVKKVEVILMVLYVVSTYAAYAVMCLSGHDHAYHLPFILEDLGETYHHL